MKKIMMANLLKLMYLTFIGLFLPAFAKREKKKAVSRPNVVFVLADDQGYGDIAVNGNPWIRTPNIDKLAADGIRFTDFHTATTCAPTRAGLMTGMYCNKVGVWHTVMGRSILKRGVTTIASMFKSAGYTTGIFGKWHLGDNYLYRPQDRGFDEVLVCRGGGVGQSPDYWNNDYFGDTYFQNGSPRKFKGYCNEVWFDNAIKFIERAQKDHKPFFCYIPSNTPHEPYHVEPKYSAPYTKNPSIPYPAFYGMITNLDENVGRLRERLKELGLADNTIFIYSSDNGTSGGVKYAPGGGETGYNAGMRGRKGSPYDGGHREPLFMYWKAGHLTGGNSISRLTGYIDLVPTLLDLCDISFPKNIHFNGRSLKPLMYGKESNWPDRILFADTQRKEFLEKWKDACIMTDEWRLVAVKNVKQLYHIKQDPGEKNNIASTHPDIVKKLSDAYDRHWNEVSADSAEYVRIVVGSKQYPGETTLSSMDCHMTEGIPAWNQLMIRKGDPETGFWALDIAQTGKYIFRLRRYPVESGLGINASAAPGDSIPGSAGYPAGKVLGIRKATIEIEGLQKELMLKDDAQAEFKLDLKKGPAELKARFVDSKGKQTDAYYVYVEKAR